MTQDPVDLMLRVARRRALQSALMAALPLGSSACNNPPQAIVPRAMPVRPAGPMPLQPSVAPPEVAVEERVQCDQGGDFPVSAGNLRPVLPVDYLAVRRVSGTPIQGATSDWTRTQFEVLSQRGTPCTGAPQGSDCETKVAHHPQDFANPQCLQMCVEISLVSTRGGEVRRWATADELREFLAPIDTVDEALLLAYAEHYDVSCQQEVSGARRTTNAYEVYATRLTSSCAPMVTTGYWLRVTETGQVSEISSEERARSDACVGRAPEGLLAGELSPDGGQRADACAMFLARSAYLEAASVRAFERLAEELEEHDAPRELVAAARQASREEAVHARRVDELAQSYGAGTFSEPKIAPFGRRALEAIALENAVEGCVRETYGAVLGAFQGVRAADTPVRLRMREIAEEELGHARLAYRVHAWLMTRLNPAARARVQVAAAQALSALRDRVSGLERSPRVERALGLPGPAQARALFEQLERDLWRPWLEQAC